MVHVPFLSLFSAIALLVMLVGIARWQRLDLTRLLITATGRSLLQLVVLGFLIALVWRNPTPWAIGGLLLFWVTIAAIATRQRIDYPSPTLVAWVWGAIFLGTFGTLAYVHLLILQGQPGFSPQFWIPLAGLLVWQIMTTTTLTGEHFVQQVKTHRNAIEAHLCLGASSHQAIATYRRAAVRAGLLPTLNNMLTIGLVGVPTFMAGQLLSSDRPLEVALNQFAILLLLVCSTLVSNLFLVWGLSHQLFNRFEQLIDDAF